MNNQYLSFWQNAFSDILDTDKQTEKINSVINQTFSQFDSITSILNTFAKTYTIEKLENFFIPFGFYSDYYPPPLKQFMATFGLISIDEYRSLINRYEKLNKEKKTLEDLKKKHSKKSNALNKTINSQKKTISSQQSELKELKSKSQA